MRRWLLAGALLAAPASAQSPPAAGWLPRGVVEIQALDKVYARSSLLTVRVGEAADATAFLTVTDDAAAPVFRGWMFAANPALAMLEHPIYDIRVLACRG